ncbi:TetR/AcrR family transcriptional regulator [Cupriavidus agavae]|uniref:TetR family transcriptional regulator n=1 Tax=Cupriavidus agavae TaxID=1001822 RepID=A0A4Q7RXA0_9BURK|nr:TetR/AcrR family transcriptional regulator [Cupriavidus agavae]RZT36852.1 TetR family transcriptional regulator [Cupriavidus agavae]
MPPLTFIPTEREDHRSVAARKKREAMRTRILRAIMDLYSDPAKISTSIEDVAREAEISRGTFYKHFTSLDEALIAVGREVTDQMTQDMLPIYDVVSDPVNRVSTGLRLFLTRALTDHRWAAFVLRAELVAQESVLLTYVMKDLRHGAHEGLMEFDNLQAAVDSVMGATVEGIRTILLKRTKDPAQYIDSTIRITLRGLAVEKRRAIKATETSRELVDALPQSVRQTWRAGT